MDWTDPSDLQVCKVVCSTVSSMWQAGCQKWHQAYKLHCKMGCHRHPHNMKINSRSRAYQKNICFVIIEMRNLVPCTWKNEKTETFSLISLVNTDCMFVNTDYTLFQTLLTLVMYFPMPLILAVDTNDPAHQYHTRQHHWSCMSTPLILLVNTTGPNCQHHWSCL